MRERKERKGKSGNVVTIIVTKLKHHTNTDLQIIILFFLFLVNAAHTLKFPKRTSKISINCKTDVFLGKSIIFY